jgi:hypothetical protein
MKTSNFFRLAISIFSIQLCACSITAKLPLTRHETAETQGTQEGRSGVEFQAAYQARNEVEFTSDYNRVAPSVTSPSVKSPGHRVMGTGALAILDSLDVSITAPQSRLSLKYQILGEPRIRAELGNFSLAVSAGIATAKEKESSSGIFSTTTQSFELRETVMDGALIAGYRFSKLVQLYGGPFIVFDKVRLSYTNSASTITTQNSSGTIRSIGANLGLHLTLSEKVFARAEGAGSKTRLGRANSGRGDFGFSMGLML